MTGKLTPQERADAERRARHALRAEKNYQHVEKPISGVQERRLVAKLKQDMERLKKTKAYKDRWRNRIVTKMFAWGEWATSSGRTSAMGSTPLGNAVKRAELNEIARAAIGYERGLSDYESMMITVDCCVSALNQADRDLLILAYQVMTDDVPHLWEAMYGKREGRFRKRKYQLLKILERKIFAD